MALVWVFNIRNQAFSLSSSYMTTLKMQSFSKALPLHLRQKWMQACTTSAAAPGLAVPQGCLCPSASGQRSVTLAAGAGAAQAEEAAQLRNVVNGTGSLERLGSYGGTLKLTLVLSKDVMPVLGMSLLHLTKPKNPVCSRRCFSSCQRGRLLQLPSSLLLKKAFSTRE